MSYLYFMDAQRSASLKLLKMKNFPQYSKRDGQSWIQQGSIYATDFNEAKKLFAASCAADLDRTDNIIHTDRDGQGRFVEVGYYDIAFNPYNLMLSDKQVSEGIEGYNDGDVTSWKICDVLTFKIIDSNDGEEICTETFESEEAAHKMYSEADGYTIELIEE